MLLLSFIIVFLHCTDRTPLHVFAFIKQLKAETGSEGMLYMLNVRWLSEVFWCQLLSAAEHKTELCPFHFACIEEVLGNMLSGAKSNRAKGSITSLSYISDKLSGSVSLTVVKLKEEVLF